MAPFLFPETFPVHHRIYLQSNIRLAGRKADRIITVSQNSKEDIVKILKVSEKKVSVVYNGVSEEFKKIDDPLLFSSFKKKHNLPDKIILYVGTIQPRKNVDILLKIFHDLKKEKRIEHKLVIIGRDGWLYNSVEDQIRSLNLENDVIRIKNLSDEELPIIYNISDLFVYPSSYEGFGLSILEAMACGVPVIASNLSSIPEVVGDAGILVDPRNCEEIKDAVYKLISNEALRQHYVKKGLERASRFSWDNAAACLIRIYNEVGG
jgi:glycosyltransferase involved in cell wall biosynthesis